ncbi:isochorismatase family protein [Roseovarius salinarum]|uniref:isochorismatase family protein n=1 Tax=Roseovarius salinarum TaxID=1981892 RepID=UPI000C3316E4|nr:isochorismatase family protein [Roseovarius salinarum]
MPVATLLLVDFQSGFDAPDWGARNNPRAEANAAALLARWRDDRAPRVHVRHVSRTPGSPLSHAAGGVAFKPGLRPAPGEPVIEKTVNAAFIGTSLAEDLAADGCEALVICGLTTPHCVSTTVRMAANLGFAVTLAHDACAAFATNADTGWSDDPAPPDPQAVHAAAVSHLHGEFCTARATDAILAARP